MSVRLGTIGKTIHTCSLSTEERKTLWEGINKADPKLAEMMNTDPCVERLRNEFGGHFTFTESEYQHFVEAALSKSNNTDQEEK